MKLQELVNKLSNMLASGAGEAEVKVDGAAINKITIDNTDNVRTVAITVVSKPLK